MSFLVVLLVSRFFGAGYGTGISGPQPMYQATT